VQLTTIKNALRRVRAQEPVKRIRAKAVDTGEQKRHAQPDQRASVHLRIVPEVPGTVQVKGTVAQASEAENTYQQGLKVPKFKPVLVRSGYRRCSNRSPSDGVQQPHTSTTRAADC
jgi:hypothetical protein